MLCIGCFDKINAGIFSCYISTLNLWGKVHTSTLKCGCNVDPPHFKIENVYVMWSNVDVMWMFCGAMLI